MSFIVTGAAGFIGANIVKGLNNRGCNDVIAVDNLTQAGKFVNLADVFEVNNLKINKKYLGIIYIIISAFCFALMNTFVKLSGDLPSIQKSFFRNFVAMIFAAILLIKSPLAWSYCR